MTDQFMEMSDASFLYKSQILTGILSKRAFVGPYFAVIASKYRCNYRCIFCEWFSPMVKNPRNEITSSCHMDLSNYKRLVRELSELGTRIILIGNIEEPFLDPYIIEKIKFAKQYNMRCFTISNGSLLNRENVEKIVDSKLDYLNVSINAGTSETYPRIHTTETKETFDRIISMVSLIEDLKEERRTQFPRTRLSMVVCNRNYQDIEKFVELCKETGAKNAIIKRLICSSNEMAAELELTPKQVEETKRYIVRASRTAEKYGINLDIELEDWIGSQQTKSVGALPCYYGWLFTVIDADGSVYPCCFRNQGSICSFGNIKTDSFRRIWFSKEYQGFRRNFKNIHGRLQMGYQCNRSSCFFNNKQVYEILHRPYLLPITYATQATKVQQLA